MSNDYQSGAAPSAQMSHAELIAEQLTNIESLGDGLPAVIAAGALRKLLRHLDEAHNREIDEIKKQVADLQQKLPKPDPNWRDICAKCFENGATEPPDCKYYTEDGCMSPIPDQHPLIQVGNAAKLREALSKSCAYFAVVLNTGMFNRVHLEALLNMAKAAIAAPARNCDVYTADELKVIFKRELVSELPIANEHEKNLITITAMRMIDALFATKKEGGNDGNE